MDARTTLTIRIKKKRDGTAALSCTRADGTVTWQRQEGAQASFFPRHDLTHYAVETVLAHRRGFYGLLAEGWEFSDFGTPWPRGPIPADADPSELIVGLLDAERACGAEWSAAEQREMAAKFLGDPAVARALALPDDEQLAQIRARRRELFAQWAALAPGETLELDFNPAAPVG
jgi:hypothetical protein